ncbi:Protein argonaute-2 [Grifola frondosa]|uniref:Protein argonaute-2 n=1 Tax=Grifola frondosa TaxID=5627 RepID=A0A1C7MF24_GRIFR|nr:Protein argonaute-2 [Grifola frondosa]
MAGRLEVQTNSFEVRQLPRATYYHFDVQIQPDLKNNRRRAFEIIDNLQNSRPDEFTPRAAFDGRCNMFSTRRITSGNYDIHMSKNPARGVFQAKIQEVNTIYPQTIQALLNNSRGQSRDQQRDQSSSTLMAINLLQIIVQQAPNMRHHFPPDARSFFIDTRARDIGRGLQAWRGFSQSVRPAVGRLLINVDVSNAAIYKPGPLPELAMEFLKLGNPRQLLTLEPRQWKELRTFLKGVHVTIRTAPGGKPRPISDLILAAGHFEFERNGMTTTVQDYFIDKYEIRLANPQLFGIRIGKSAVFPAELCTVVKGQVYRKKLSPELQSGLLQFSTQKPVDRMREIRGAVGGFDRQPQLFDYTTSDFIKEAGMSVSLEPITVTGRVHGPPQIMYGNGSRLMVKGGGWNVVNQRLLEPATIKSWAVVLFGNHNIEAVKRMMEQLMGNLGKLASGRPHIEFGGQDVGSALLKAGLAAVSQANLPKGSRPTILICFLPQEAAELRSRIKSWGDTENMVPTQCLRMGKYDKTNAKHLDQYCNNVALKINVKIGGINSRLQLDPAALGGFLSKSIVIGADVGHPGPGLTSRPSITSVVSSVNADATLYSAFASVQAPRKEIISDLEDMVMGALNDYRAFNQRHGGKMPETIIFLRDGVSEGEFEQVSKHEIAAIRSAVEKLRQYFPRKPKLVFMIVGKRHHVRFFPRQQDADRSGNCPAGFAVDDQITHPCYEDFYLLSHGGLLGTSRPSHYIVLENEPHLTLVQLQELVYALCHVYAGATRSVSIPAPVYYADKVCGRAVNHFPPELNFADETATTSSGGTATFNLEHWKRNFKKAQLFRQMYFV